MNECLKDAYEWLNRNRPDAENQNYEAFNIISALVGEVEKGGWISVNDRLPKGDLHVLTFSDDARVRSMSYDPHYKYFSTYSDVWILSHVGYEPSDAFKVTHWMPLPESPKV